MSILSIVTGMVAVNSVGQSTEPPPPPPPPTTYFTPTVEGVMYDNGQYNGFPFPVYDSNTGIIYSVHKRSDSHAAGGDLVLLKSTNGGTTNTATAIGMCGTDATNLSFGKAANRLFLAWQNGTDVLHLKVAYSDDFGATWSTPQTITFTKDSYLSPFPPTVMPSGKVIFDVYQYEAGSPKYFSEFYTTNNGSAWTVREAFITRTGTVYPNEPCNEYKRIITHNTGVDATCKVVIIARSHVYPSGNHFSSTDGGQTFTHNSTNLIDVWNRPQGEEYGSRPYELFKKSDGKFLMIVGDRYYASGAHYSGEYIELTADELFNNAVINSKTRVVFYTESEVTANTNGAARDWGYLVAFEDYQQKVFVRGYDTSTLAALPTVTRRCVIKQIKVCDPTPS